MLVLMSALIPLLSISIHEMLTRVLKGELWGKKFEHAPKMRIFGDADFASVFSGAYFFVGPNLQIFGFALFGI